MRQGCTVNKELLTACMPVQNTPAKVTVLYEEGRPAEVYIEPEQANALIGQIVIGKVESVSAGLSAAFVRTGPDQRAYLPLSSADAGIRPGDELAVQFIQEAQKTKLPKVSSVLELSGNYLVLSSQAGKPVCSRKLTAEQKQALLRMASAWDAEDCGILFRTRAASADPNEVSTEFLHLYELLQNIRRKASARTCYTVLYESPLLQHVLISRCQPGELQRFVTDDPTLAASVHDACLEAGCTPELYADPQLALYRLRSLSGLLDHLASATVPLRSGGSLIIEQTEAFAVIDVNTARYTGKRDHPETVRRINQEAAREAARQIRLRQLSGTILIDFINCDIKQEEELGKILNAQFFSDPVSTKLVDFTKLHICEITRRKVHRSLKEQLHALKKS